MEQRHEIKIAVHGQWVKRRVTASEYIAYKNATVALANRVMDGVRAGDMVATANAQKACRDADIPLPGIAS